MLEALIKERIHEFGPISVADYMALALSHPQHGYYMKRDPLGAAGDFTTAPEISQVFGEIIGAWLAAQWKKIGSPECALVELGPGRGTLMSDILRATKNVKGFHDAVNVHLVETSPVLKQKQWALLAAKHADVQWHESIDTLPELPLLLVANEFFDALPIRQFYSDEERMIDIKNDTLVFTGEGEIRETCEPAIAIIKKLSHHITTHGGCALIIDYGYAHGEEGDTLQAMKNHTFHDVLKDTGDADITAHVDFLALKNAATASGISAYGAVPQGAWLMRLGAGQRTTNLCANAGPEQQQTLMIGLKRLADPSEMGELFKVLCIASSSLGKPEGF